MRLSLCGAGLITIFKAPLVIKLLRAQIFVLQALSHTYLTVS